MNFSTAGQYCPPDRTRQLQLGGLALASFRSRALALSIDGLIVALLLLLPGIVTRFTINASDRPLTLTLDFGALASFVITLLYFGLGTYLGKGATFGKRMLGIRVVSVTHAELSLWHSIERALGYAASSLEAGFGFLQYYTHPNRQTVHDRIAETVVIVDPRQSPKPATTVHPE